MRSIFIGDIEVVCERKKIKNMHIYVKPPLGEVLLTAPLRIPDSEIDFFVRSKAEWIIKNVARMKNTPVTPEPRYETGETISVWGDLYTLCVTEGTRYSLTLENASVDGLQANVAHLTVRTDSTVEQREHFLTEWYRNELTERVEILLPQWEAYTGLKCSGWQSKVMKTRWGTCNTKTKKVWLNVGLAKYPVSCLEYVILHELTHTKVPNHGEDFKAVLNEYMPDWKEKRRRLKTQ